MGFGGEVKELDFINSNRGSFKGSDHRNSMVTLHLREILLSVLKLVAD